MKSTLSVIFYFVLIIAFGQNNFEPCSDEFSKSSWYSQNKLDKSKIVEEKSPEEYILAALYIDPSLTYCNEYLSVLSNQKTNKTTLVFKELCFVENKQEVKKYTKELTDTEAKLIVDLYIVALFHVEYYPSPIEVADGTSYHLQAEYWAVGQQLCGFIHAPEQGLVNDFLDISRELIKFAKSEENRIDLDLTEEISELTNTLNVKKLNLESPTMETQMFGEKFEFF